MAVKLPKYMDKETGKIYFMDVLLLEFRNVDDPHDRIPLETEKEFEAMEPATDRPSRRSEGS